MRNPIKSALQIATLSGLIFLLSANAAKAHNDKKNVKSPATTAAAYEEKSITPVTQFQTNTPAFQIVPDACSKSIINVVFPNNDLENSKADILDKNGNPIARRKAAANTLSFDLSNYAPGLYTVKIWQNNLEIEAEINVSK